MDRKKELKYLFKETHVEAGVYKIENTENHKIFIGSTRNIKTLNGVKFSLDTGTNYNKKLQKEWTECGKDVFEFTVLEKLKVN
ncbi:MAG: GIY-YIG nuclease family protein, partial [Bacillota bacterium]|nr:GIY-YIG nuclease family protein [Bacillota bacterium]